MTYQIFRNTHLIAGLFLSVFLVAYGASALQMAYPVYRPAPVVTTMTVVVPEDVPATARPLAAWLAAHSDVRGELSDVSTEPALRFSVSRPGTIQDVEFDVATHTARVSTGTMNAIGMLNALHHAAGVRHELAVLNLWGWMVVATSGGLLVLAVTGIVLWFRRHNERRIGAVVLVVGLVWGGLALVLVRWP